MSHSKPYLMNGLFERNKRELLGYLTRRVGREDAADLLQETFVRVLRRGQFEAVDNPPALLHQIAINLVRDFVRRRKTEASHFEFGDLPEDVPSSEVPAEERIAHQQRLRCLRAAADTLPPRCREVFIMAAFEDVPLDEIAKRLDISRNMVEKHMRFALHRCRAATLG
jgi:RNA polymerase sigma-70 factor (ECF subfamily)